MPSRRRGFDSLFPLMNDAGLDAVWAVCPDASDAGLPFELDGGAWVLPPPRGPRTACLLAGCEEYARRSERPVPALSTPALMLSLALLGLGLLLGLYGGWSLAGWLKGR